MVFIHGVPSVLLELSQQKVQPIQEVRLNPEKEEILNSLIKDCFILSPLYKSIGSDEDRFVYKMRFDQESSNIARLYVNYFPTAEEAIEDLNNRWAKLIQNRYELSELPKFTEDIPLEPRSTESWKDYSGRGTIVRLIKSWFCR